MFLNWVSIVKASLSDSIFLRNSVVSSASCVILNIQPPMLKPCIYSLFFIAMESTSTAITNNRADNGHPSLIPAVQAKYFDVMPLFKTHSFQYCCIEWKHILLI